MRKLKRKVKRCYLLRARFLGNLSVRLITLPRENNYRSRISSHRFSLNNPPKSQCKRVFPEDRMWGRTETSASGAAPRSPFSKDLLSGASGLQPRVSKTLRAHPGPPAHQGLAKIPGQSQIQARSAARTPTGAPPAGQPTGLPTHTPCSWGCRVRKGLGKARLPSAGEADLAKNRTGASLSTRQGFSRNLPEAPQQGGTHRKHAATRPSAPHPQQPSLLRPYLGPLDCRHLSPRQTGWGGDDRMTPDTPLFSNR